MDPRFDLRRIVGDGEFERGIRKTLLALEDEGYALFKLRRINWIVEQDLGDGLLCGRIFGILVELAGAGRYGERSCGQAQVILRNQHMMRESGCRIERDVEMGAD